MYTLLNNYVLVKPTEETNETVNGIETVQFKRGDVVKGQVVSSACSDIEEGVRILYPTLAYEDLDLGEQKYHLVDGREVYATIDE